MPGPPPAGVSHRWDLTPGEAIALQRGLSAAVEREDRLGAAATLAGVDVAYGRRGGPATAAAAAVLFGAADLRPLDQARVELTLAFPYVPGLLSFREAPAAIAAIRRLVRGPDLLLCDGHGIAHPRRIGIASHLGLCLDLPSIGVAKSILVGSHGPLGPARGDWTPLVDRGEVIGAALRTRPGVRPVYVSIGHRVCLATAIAIVLQCTGRFRLPEPIRAADRLSKARGLVTPPTGDA